MVIYCDEDLIDDAGRTIGSLRKPAWSYDHLLCRMYLGRGWCIRKGTFLALAGFRGGLSGAHDYDLVLRAATLGTPVWHVASALYRRRAAAAADPIAAGPDPGLAAVEHHLAQLRIVGSVEAGLHPRTYRVRPRMPKELVGINILAVPDRSSDEPQRSSFVEELIDSIRLHTPTLGFELRIFVGARQAAALAHLEADSAQIRVVPHVAPSDAVSLPALANLAVRSSRLERLVLLRDSLRAVDGGWLEALMECLEIPGVGAVGGRILRPGGALRHAGLTMGGSGRGVRFVTGGADDGDATEVIRNCAAVSGAMLGLRRSAFLLVGGFDENLTDELSDADFCLKLHDQGLRTVYTPHASMLALDPGFGLTEIRDGLQRRYFERRWPARFAHDPFYTMGFKQEGMP